MHTCMLSFAGINAIDARAEAARRPRSPTERIANDCIMDVHRRRCGTDKSARRERARRRVAVLV